MTVWRNRIRGRASAPPTAGPAGRRGRGALRVCLSLGLALALVWAPARAQEIVGVVSGPRMASRAQLQATLDSLETAAAPTDSRERRRSVSDRIASIRHRLEQGDVFPGDVVVLEVRDQPQWTDSFTVTPARNLELPDLNDPISLEGVLYAEVEETLARELARYLKEPRVRADVLKRVAILGQVGSPGFYHLKGSALVSDAVMTAGGPAGKAKLKKVRIRRGGERIAEGFPEVAFQNLSLDQLGVRSGDELFVPGGGGSPWRVALGVLGGITSIAFLVTRF